MVRPRSLGLPSLFGYTASVRATLHRFLLMLLMLALPLQGLASASMSGCISSDPAEESQAVAEPMVMAGCHEHKQPHSSPVPHDCKHCAACMPAAALPVPANILPALALASNRFIAHPTASFSGFIPDSPERPPRLSLA